MFFITFFWQKRQLFWFCQNLHPKIRKNTKIRQFKGQLIYLHSWKQEIMKKHVEQMSRVQVLVSLASAEFFRTNAAKLMALELDLWCFSGTMNHFSNSHCTNRDLGWIDPKNQCTKHQHITSQSKVQTHNSIRIFVRDQSGT